jgi:polyisoprenoid-binding protein YceI
MRTRALLPSLILIAGLGRGARAQVPTAGAPPGLPQRFAIDPPHSSIGFSVRFMGLSTVRGAFARFGGDILYVPNRPDRWSVSAIILASSINTNATTRDRHLRSPDFLGVEQYPYITFRSTGVQPTPTGFAVQGDFSLHGVSKHISLPFTMLNPPVADAWGNSRMTLQAQFRVSRREYGILGTAFWNSEFDPGRMAVADGVDIELLISAIVPNVQRWTDPFADSLLADIQRQGVAGAVAALHLESAPPRLDSVPDFSFIVAGEKLRATGQDRDAARLYDALMTWRPRSQEIAGKAGETYLTLGDTARARTIFEHVMQIDSLDTTASEWLRLLSSRRP